MNADDVRRGWAQRSTEFSPGYYAYYGPNETSEAVRRTLDRLVGQDATVLELGCSSGRHLKHLHDHGYGDLHGVDINDEAFDVMATEYPGLAADGQFYHAAIEDAVRGFDDGQFEAVVSVETLQHIHADDQWVFEEVARITDDVVLTVECEVPGGDDRSTVGDSDGGRGRPADPTVKYVDGDLPLYYRNWKHVFTDVGLRERESRTLDGDTFRVFATGED